MDYLLLLSSIGLGVGVVFLFKLHQPRHVKVLNAFTGAYLLCLTLLHLLPELYQEHGGRGHDHDLGVRLGIIMLAGFFTQLALDFISLGVEHGHAHHFQGKLPIGVVLGLCLHALIEAMALGNVDTHYDPTSRRLLLWSIVLHNFPVSIALLGMLLQSGMRTKYWVGVLLIFSAMAPIGMTLSAHSFLANYSRELTAFVIGIFMHISTTILFESGDSHRVDMPKLGAIVVGTAMAFASLLIH
jgi:zinc transporter ZupT